MTTHILIVSGADTGRAPMATALLRRLLHTRQLAWQVRSAGVLGHDDAPAEVEARDAMVHFGLDVSHHRAQSLTSELLHNSTLVLAIDSGTARVIRERFPEATARLRTLGELAGRTRDIPDPFRMQIGAWLSYARELETLLTTALPSIVSLLEATATAPATEPSPAQPSSETASPRSAAIDRAERVLALAAELPHVFDWATTRGQLEADIAAAGQPFDATDLAPAYVGLLRALLAITPLPPSRAHILALKIALARLQTSIAQRDIDQLSARFSEWSSL